MQLDSPAKIVRPPDVVMFRRFLAVKHVDVKHTDLCIGECREKLLGCASLGEYLCCYADGPSLSRAENVARIVRLYALKVRGHPSLASLGRGKPRPFLFERGLRPISNKKETGGVEYF